MRLEDVGEKIKSWRELVMELSDGKAVGNEYVEVVDDYWLGDAVFVRIRRVEEIVVGEVVKELEYKIVSKDGRELEIITTLEGDVKEVRIW